MGHLGNPGHPDVIAAIGKGLNQIKASGKHAGVFCMDPALARDYVEQGANFLAVATDTLVLSQGLKRTVTEFRDGKPAAEEKPQAGY
jgi:4-hydroxy-2-oxoheptanedioate aldolase